MPDADVQARLLRATLRLPGPVLDLLAAREPAELGGRRLDPRFRMLAYLSRRRPRTPDAGVDEVRAGAARVFALGQGRPEPGVRWEALGVPGAEGERPARLYRPPDQDAGAPPLLWLHQGGGVVGDLETGHAFCTVLARACRTAVVALGYRLAPEHPYPAGVDDALAAYRWLREAGSRWGAAPGRAGVGGDSAGGWMAALVCHRLRAAGEPQPALQLLVYPAVDFAGETQSTALHADSFPLSADLAAWFRARLFAPGTDLADPSVSPLRAPALEGLAPAVVVTAGWDPLVDQGEAYAHRLVEAADATLYRCYDRLAHGYLSFTGLVPAADVAAREIAGLARQGLEGLLPVSARARAAHAQPAPTASATERKPSAWRRWRRSRASRATSPGPP